MLVENDLTAGLLLELAVEEARQPEPVWLAMRTADKGGRQLVVQTLRLSVVKRP
ncbi:MAG: hypothetical protein WC782_08415 [Methylococcaceae bacterium]